VRPFKIPFNRLRFSGIFLLVIACGEKKADTRFTALPARETGIEFANPLQQTEEFNIIEYLYFYNGGGVAAGDINNDGLTDLYFSANQLSNKLYLNQGNLVFEDITEHAGASGVGNWKTGVTMADVNADGYLDIFICGVGNYKRFTGRNQLLINNGDLTFTDRTDEYGLSFQGFSTHAAFFDYDNDGDLDLYLLNHSVHSARSYGHSRLRLQSDRFAGDKLYRNDFTPEGKIRFTEVTSSSGIYNSQVGYGLGIGISDLNLDGFMDIYVSNDFHENDYLYVNRRDGTFEEVLAESVPHVSRFSMGNDIGDINNDGLADIMTLDMLPRKEEVIKTTAGEDPYDIYQFKLNFGYHHQFARNTLQLNRGFTKDGRLLFSDIAPLAGVAASDWSWSPLLADFDNDGSKDLFITNGILTRPNDLDYINFISSDSIQRNYEYEAFIKNMPSGEVPNFFFRNTGDLQFQDVTEAWIGEKAGVSTGAVYADLDNDGDLDLVVNNINAEASVYRNDIRADSGGWLQLELEGESPNAFGIGTKVMVYSGRDCIYQEQVLSRGWQSSVSPIMHIGIGRVTAVDSVCIVWPDATFQTLVSVRKNQRMKVYQKDAKGAWDYREKKRSRAAFLERDDTILFRHRENDFNAFAEEKLIPHMVSTQGPNMSVGDVNGDGLDDFFIGGAAGQRGEIFIQHPSGGFSSVGQRALLKDSLYEDVGSAIFDVDGNGTQDLLVVSGGQELSGENPLLQPRLYLNDGKGTFHRSQRGVPEIFINASCVKPADVDGDGDLDVFIGGRVLAGRYGIDPESFLLLNDEGVFKNASMRLPGASIGGRKLGMVTDASWCDLDNNGMPDLMLVGEWMPVTVLLQDSSGYFDDRTAAFGLGKTNGWWNTIAAADFDGDGDTDFVAGNLGLNSRLKAAPRQPVKLYVGDMDQNGGIDHLLTYFNDDVQHPFISRDQLVKQVPSFKREFLKYGTFRQVRREDIIPSEELENYTLKQAYCFASVYLENRDGHFTAHPLPVEAQMFPVFSLCTDDFNGDGMTDLLAVGNLFAIQPELGRYDAGYGLMMLGDGKGRFESRSAGASGFMVKGEGRDIKVLEDAKKNNMYLVSRNNESLLVFRKE
jgi:hypothetical protein